MMFADEDEEATDQRKTTKCHNCFRYIDMVHLEYKCIYLFLLQFKLNYLCTMTI